MLSFLSLPDRALRDKRMLLSKDRRHYMQPFEIAGRQVVPRDCPACGFDNAKATPNPYSSAFWVLKDCQACGFVYLEAAPVYKELAETYAWEKTSVARDQARRQQHPLLYRISKVTRWCLHLFKRNKRIEELLTHYVGSGNVLDIGCGKGDQLKKLPPAFVPYGIEISRAEAAHALLHVKPRHGDVIVKPAVEGLQVFTDSFFSGVLMRSYLEHEAAPKAVLQGAFRVLRTGGVIILKVPNYDSLNRRIYGNYWCGFRLPDHLNYFTPESLTRLCRDCGFTMARFGWLDRLPTSDNMWLVARKAA